MDTTRQIFQETIKDFLKKTGLKMLSREFRGLVRELDLQIGIVNTKDNYFGKDFDSKDEDWKALKEYHEKMVQSTLDFLNANPGILKRMEEKRKEQEGEMKSDMAFPYPIPGRVYFGMDYLEDSLKAGKWVSSMDSYLEVCTGVNVVIDSR